MRDLSLQHELSLHVARPHREGDEARRACRVQQGDAIAGDQPPPESFLPLAVRYRVRVLLRVRVGEHLVAGTPVAWMWTAGPDQASPDPAVFRQPLQRTIRLGFERTVEQDAAFGIRQLVDMACKALSLTVNDPYTAVQAIDRLSVIFCSPCCPAAGR